MTFLKFLLLGFSGISIKWCEAHKVDNLNENYIPFFVYFYLIAFMKKIKCLFFRRNLMHHFHYVTYADLSTRKMSPQHFCDVHLYRYVCKTPREHQNLFAIFEGFQKTIFFNVTWLHVTCYAQSYGLWKRSCSFHFSAKLGISKEAV